MSLTSSFVLFHLVLYVSIAHSDPIEVPEGEMLREVRARLSPQGQLVYFTMSKLDKCEVDKVGLPFNDTINYAIDLLYKYKVMRKPPNDEDKFVCNLKQMSEQDFNREYGLEFQFKQPDQTTGENINSWFESECDQANVFDDFTCDKLKKMLETGDLRMRTMILSSFWCKFKFETTRSYVQKSMAQVCAQIAKWDRNSKEHFITEFVTALDQMNSAIVLNIKSFPQFAEQIFEKNFVDANFDLQQMRQGQLATNSLHKYEYYGLFGIPQELELFVADEMWNALRFFRDVNSDGQLTNKFRVYLGIILEREFVNLYGETQREHANAFKIERICLKIRALFLVIKDAFLLVEQPGVDPKVDQKVDPKIVDKEDDKEQTIISGNGSIKLEDSDKLQDASATRSPTTNGKPFPWWIKAAGVVTMGAVLVSIACGIFGCIPERIVTLNSETVSNISQTLSTGSFISTIDGHQSSINLSVIVSALLVSLMMIVLVAFVFIWHYRRNVHQANQCESSSASPSTTT